MSSIIVSEIEGLKLKNGKVIPFMLSASNNVRTAYGALAWSWHNIFLRKHSFFMFENAEELRPQMKDWASQGMFKFRGGTFITEKGMMKKLSEAFKKPLFHFEDGLVMVDYIQVSKDKTKATHVLYKPKSEEDFLAYMEKNKNRSLNISIVSHIPNNISEILTGVK